MLSRSSLPLMVKGAVEVSEELKRGFVPKTQAFIRLAEAYRDETKLQAVFEDLRAKKQRASAGQLLGFKPYLESRFIEGLSKKSYWNAVVIPCGIGGLLKRGILRVTRKRWVVCKYPSAACKRALNPLSPASEKPVRDP